MSFAEGVFQRSESKATPPAATAHLWEAFWDIFRAPGDMGGGHPVSWAEMRGWCDLTGRQLLPWEARLIRRLGDAWLRIDGEKRVARQGKGGPSGRSNLTEAAMRPVRELRGFMAKFGKKG